MAGVQGGSGLHRATLSTTLRLSPPPRSHASGTQGQEGKGWYVMEAKVFAYFLD